MTESEDQKVLCTQIQAYAMTTKNYSRIKLKHQPDKVTATFKLIPKKVPYHEDHIYDHFSGKTTIKILPVEKGAKTDRYQLHFSMRLKLDPEVPKVDFLIRHMLRKLANHTVRGLLVF